MTFLELRDFQKKFILPELHTLDDDELILVAYGITNPLSISIMQSDWSKSDSPNKAIGRDSVSTRKIRPIDFGGSLTLLKIDKDDVAKFRVFNEDVC